MKYLSHLKRILLFFSIQGVVTQDVQETTLSTETTLQETDKVRAMIYLKNFFGLDVNKSGSPDEAVDQRLEEMRSYFFPPIHNQNDAPEPIRHDDTTYNYLKRITPSERRGSVCYESYGESLEILPDITYLKGFWYDKHGYRFVTLEISDRLIKITIDQSPTQEFRGDFRQWDGDFFSLLGGNPLLYEQSVIPRLLSMKKQQNAYELIMTRRPVTNSVYLREFVRDTENYSRTLLSVKQGNIFCSVDSRYMRTSIEVKHWEMKNKTDDRLYIFFGIVRIRTVNTSINNWISGECMGPLVIDRKTGAVYPADPYSGCGRNPENDIYLQQYTKPTRHSNAIVASIISVVTGMTLTPAMNSSRCGTYA